MKAMISYSAEGIQLDLGDKNYTSGKLSPVALARLIDCLEQKQNGVTRVLDSVVNGEPGTLTIFTADDGTTEITYRTTATRKSCSVTLSAHESAVLARDCRMMLDLLEKVGASDTSHA